MLLSILLVLILILGAFIIRHKMSRSRNSNDASNYTLGSSSGCTDQLVMTSSPSATHDGMISDGTDSEHFIYISSRNKPHQIYHNRRLSHIIHRNGKFLASKLPNPRDFRAPEAQGSTDQNWSAHLLVSPQTALSVYGPKLVSPRLAGWDHIYCDQ